MTRVVVVPRRGGTAGDDWYPWARGELAARGVAFEVLDLPAPADPRVEPWVDGVSAALAAGDLRATVLCGHSVGCRAALAAIDRLPADARLAGCVLAAAWWSLDQPWPEVRPWEALEHDGARIRAVAGRPIVLLSDDDPYTADWDANARFWRERLDADVRIVSRAGHFTGEREQAVLTALLDAAGIER